MDATLNWGLAEGYKNPAQIAKVLTENWVESQVYCPACANCLQKLKDNTPVGDFVCLRCKEEYELKSKKNNFSRKIVDGAWSEMAKKVSAGTNPNFFLLNYALQKRHEGYTYQPGSTSFEPDIENLQVIGFAGGNSREEATRNLLTENIPYKPTRRNLLWETKKMHHIF